METDMVVILSEHGSRSQNALKFCFIKRLLDGGKMFFQWQKKIVYKIRKLWKLVISVYNKTVKTRT